MKDRTTILISCLADEAQQIRQRARAERRTVSGYILAIVMRAVAFEERLSQTAPQFAGANQVLARLANLPRGLRTTVLLHCSSDESKRIRGAAARRDVNISAFIRLSLRRSWGISDAQESPHQSPSQIGGL